LEIISSFIFSVDIICTKKEITPLCKYYLIFVKNNLMRKLLLIAFLLSFCLPLISQMGGSHTYQFLSLPVSSRIAALGGNNVSHYENDINFAYQNPGLLRKGMSDKVMLNYINYLKDINIGQASYVKNFENIGTFAGGIQYINYGHFYNADEIGNILGDFVPAEYAISFSYGHNVINEKFNVGATLKFIISDFWEYSSYGFAVDAGMTYIDTAKLLSVGLVVKNLGTQIKPYTKGNYEPIPFDIQLGLTKKFAHAPLAISITAQDLTNWNLSYNSIFKDENIVMNDDEEEKKNFFNRLGDIGDEFIRHFVLSAEIIPHKNFYISLGFNYKRRAELALPTKTKLAGMSIGFGLQLSKFSVSYGLASYHLAGASHHFSVGLNLGAFYRKV
jgi:hypothetical protein